MKCVVRSLFSVTFILLVCSSSVLAQQSASRSGVRGQIFPLDTAGFQQPVLVVLDPLGGQRPQQTFTDFRGYFEFSNLPTGSYYIRVRLEGFEDVDHRVDIPGTPDVSIFLHRRLLSVRQRDADDALGGRFVVDIRQLTANIPKPAIKEYEKALKEIKQARTQRAIERLEKSIKLAPDFYNAHLYLAQEYRKAGRLDAAGQECIRASELNSREGAPLIQLGEIYLEQKSFERAAGVLERAVRLSPGSAVAHYALGRTLYELSEYKRAEQAFKRASFLDEKFEAARVMLLNVYLRQGRLVKALESFDELLKKNPQSGKNPALEKFKSQLVEALAK